MVGVFKRVGLYYEVLLEIEDVDLVGLFFNLYILIIVVSLYLYFEMYEEVLEVCRVLWKCGFIFDGLVYNVMIYVFGNVGRVDEVVWILMEM